MSERNVGREGGGGRGGEGETGRDRQGQSDGLTITSRMTTMVMGADRAGLVWTDSPADPVQDRDRGRCE